MNQFTKQLAILFIALTSLQSCDVEKFIDTNIKEKSLVVIAPDFIQNRVAIVFEDADTGALIEEDLEVRLIASEMLIDLAGNYKNDFTAKRGLLNFAVDPNEEINENSPLFFQVLINDHLSDQSFFKVSTNNAVIRLPVKNRTSLNLNTVFNKTSAKSDTEMPITLNFNGKTIDEFNDEINDQTTFSGYNILNLTSTSKLDFLKSDITATFEYTKINDIDDETIYGYFSDKHYENMMPKGNSNTRHFRQLMYSGYNEDQRYANQNYLLSQPELKKPTIISVELNPGFSRANIDHYKLNIKLVNDNNEILFYRIKESGDYDLRSRPTSFSLSSLRLPNEYTFVKSAKFQPWNNEIAIPAGSRIIHVDLTTITNSETQQCKDGFNLNFEMIGVNKDDRPNLLYKIERNSGATSHIGYASLTKDNSSHNTAFISKGHSYGKLSNKIIFDDNLQYDIIPNTMELGGLNACGKTYNFKVISKDLKKYKMNVQFQCSGDEFSTAPTLVAFFNETNTPEKVDMINLNNGGTSLYLKPEATYSVQGSFNETEFGFTFTANESQIEQAIAKTIAENNNIKDIEYTISKINNVESVINAKIIFKEGACPE